MSGPNSACDLQQLEQLLAGGLSVDQESAASSHLAECPSCQEQLASLAGEQNWWTEVASSLRNHLDELQQSGVVPETLALRDPVDGPPPSRETQAAWIAADFAVDFLQPSDREDALGRLGDVEIVEYIGRGGMGIVLKGFQHQLNRHVAVKVMAPHLATSGSARARFAREAQAAAGIVHPNVMAIHSVDASGKLPYLVMPYVSCESLQQRLDRTGPLELVQVLRIAHQIAAGLAAAHAQGIVHRDVKPANILLEKGVDRVVLTDFGLARAVDDASLTHSGVIAGTPQFMSPEQARGDSIDARSDLFSLGSVLYAMATGRVPFRAETTFGVLRRITDTEPRAIRELNPEIPDWLVATIARLHAKSAHDRFDRAEQVADLLAQSLAHVQQPTSIPLPTEIRVLEQAYLAANSGPDSTRPHRLSSTLNRIIPQSTWGRAALVALICGGLALAIPTFPDFNNHASSPSEQVEANTNSADSDQPDAPDLSLVDDPLDSQLSWDSPAVEIEELGSELPTLESRVNDLWDWHPTSVTNEPDEIQFPQESIQ